MKIFVTGACGFIGSHIIEKLVKNNYTVKAFTLYSARGSNGWLDNLEKKILKEIEIISGDIRDQQFLIKSTKRVDVIFHLAALIGIPYSYSAVKSYIDTNVSGTFNILNAALQNNVSQSIITSTSEVYGTAKFVPITENHSLNAQSPYAATKISADQLAISFNKSFRLPLAILRPFNTFGPRQSARAIIPTILTQILNKKQTIRLGNLHPRRDFTYVEDTAEAFLKSIKNKKINGQVINLGTGFEVSILEILEILKKDYNFKFKIKSDNFRIRKKSSEVERLLSSNEKAKEILDWEPKYKGLVGFKMALKKTIDWFKNPKNLKKYNPNIYTI